MSRTEPCLEPLANGSICLQNLIHASRMYPDCGFDIVWFVIVNFQVKSQRRELRSKARVVPITLEQVTVLELKVAVELFLLL